MDNSSQTEEPPTSCLGMTAVKQSQPVATFLLPVLRTGPRCRSVCGENALALHNTADYVVYTETSIYGRPSTTSSTGVTSMEIHRKGRAAQGSSGLQCHSFPSCLNTQLHWRRKSMTQAQSFNWSKTKSLSIFPP